MNHVVFSRIDGELTGSHTSQFWISTLKNVFPSAVVLELLVVLKCCLSQVALYRIRLGSYPISLVSLMTSEPSFRGTLSMLFKSSMRASILWFVLLAAITQAVTLTSIFIPGTLTVNQSPTVTTSLYIPTIDFNTVDPTTSSLITEDIWPSGGTNTTDSLLAFPLNSTDLPLNEYFFYNSSYAFTTPDENNPNVSLSTLDVIYMEGFNTTPAEALSLFSQYPDPTQYNPLGTHCEYQNATYEATTIFSNNTQSSSTRVMQMTGSLPIGHDADGPHAGTNTTNMTLAFRSIAQAFSELLSGNAFFQANVSGLVTDSTQALNTPLFSLTSAIQNTTEPGESVTMNSVFFFGLSPSLAGNLSPGVQSLLGNVTLAFVSQQMGSTLANVTMTPNSTQYQYRARKLGLIYGIVFGVSLVLVLYGLMCLWKNGSTAVFDLEHIVEMTSASKGLHESAVHPRFGSTPVKGVMFSDRVFTSAVKLDVNR
ncbi:hypothetical protein BT96DRAFT_998619 [Gymnopus androsaceus JB14]|uniref:Uncharacterized protein n=1 Tax=Gymnopus androsaceus JB14 TaxID=1447944 RepID=A0A6A4H9N9_9AGAR|nr:hypothetical protein BT96DRAFT_998619 [Gymnopus androsaceus JB14]